jgi:hypothetical protein
LGLLMEVQNFLWVRNLILWKKFRRISRLKCYRFENVRGKSIPGVGLELTTEIIP